VALTVARERARMGDVLVAGPDTFLDELLSRLGAENAFADAPLRYPQVGLEAFLERQPTAIIELQPQPMSAEEVEKLERDWLAAPGLAAVDRGCLAVISGEHVLLPGPRLARLYDELRTALRSCEPKAAAS
jgi:ABC-type hemin transport system substrate-binding protein